MSIHTSVMQERHATSRRSFIQSQEGTSPVSSEPPLIAVIEPHGVTVHDVIGLFIGEHAPHVKAREELHAAEYLQGERVAFADVLRPHAMQRGSNSGTVVWSLGVEEFRAILHNGFVRRLGRDAYISGAVRVDPKSRNLSGERLDEMKRLLGSIDGPLFLQFLNGVSEVARKHIGAL